MNWFKRNKRHLLLTAVLAAMSVYYFIYFSNNPPGAADDFFNMALGKYYLQNGIFGNHLEPFSWWAKAYGNHYYPFQWLYQIIIYGVYSLGGFLARNIFATLSAVAFHTLLLTYLLTKTKNAYFAFTYWIGLSVASILIFDKVLLTNRPQTTVLVLLMLALIFLEKKKNLAALLLYPLMLNFHAGLLPILVVFYLFYWHGSKTFKYLIWLLPLSFLTPMGYNLFFVIKNFTGVAELAKLLPTEWQSVLTYSPEMIVFWVMLLMMTGYVILREFQAHKSLKTFFVVVPLAISALLPLLAFRYMVFYMLIVLPMYSCYFEKHYPVRISNEKWLLAISSAVIVLLLSVSFTIDGMNGPPASYGYDASNQRQLSAFPDLRILQYIKDNGIRHVFNVHLGYGGYMEYMGVSPMLDNRNDAFYENGLFEAYLLAGLGNDGQKVSFIKKYDVQYILIADDSADKTDNLIGKYEIFVKESFQAGKLTLEKHIRNATLYKVNF